MIERDLIEPAVTPGERLQVVGLVGEVVPQARLIEPVVAARTGRVAVLARRRGVDQTKVKIGVVRRAAKIREAEPGMPGENDQVERRDVVSDREVSSRD